MVEEEDKKDKAAAAAAEEQLASLSTKRFSFNREVVVTEAVTVGRELFIGISSSLSAAGLVAAGCSCPSRHPTDPEATGNCGGICGWVDADDDDAVVVVIVVVGAVVVRGRIRRRFRPATVGSVTESCCWSCDSKVDDCEDEKKDNDAFEQGGGDE